MLWISALLVFGTFGWVLVALGESDRLVPGFEQLIHAEIPWIVLGALWLGGALGLLALFRRRRRWFHWPVVGLELALVGPVSFYVLQLSWLPPHSLAIDVGAPFPSYALLDQDEQLRTREAGAPRPPELYIFYRGDW